MLQEMTVQTERSRHSLPQPVLWLIAALLVLSLGIAPNTQFPALESSADDSFGTSLLLQKKISDNDRALDAAAHADIDSSFDALLASTVHVFASNGSSLSTTRYLAASYLAACISASPRAPPFLQLV